MLRLHKTDGCWRAQTLTFSSYEYCEVDPVPKALYTHYCHDCWPSAAPAVESMDREDSESTDSDTSTDASGIAFPE